MSINNSSQVFQQSVIRLSAIIFTTFVLIGCSGGGGSVDDEGQNGGDASIK